MTMPNGRRRSRRGGFHPPPTALRQPDGNIAVLTYSEPPADLAGVENPAIFTQQAQEQHQQNRRAVQFNHQLAQAQVGDDRLYDQLSADGFTPEEINTLLDARVSSLRAIRDMYPEYADLLDPEIQRVSAERFRQDHPFPTAAREERARGRLTAEQLQAEVRELEHSQPVSQVGSFYTGAMGMGGNAPLIASATHGEDVLHTPEYNAQLQQLGDQLDAALEQQNPGRAARYQEYLDSLDWSEGLAEGATYGPARNLTMIGAAQTHPDSPGGETVTPAEAEFWRGFRQNQAIYSAINIASLYGYGAILRGAGAGAAALATSAGRREVVRRAPGEFLQSVGEEAVLEQPAEALINYGTLGQTPDIADAASQSIVEGAIETPAGFRGSRAPGDTIDGQMLLSGVEMAIATPALGLGGIAVAPVPGLFGGSGGTSRARANPGVIMPPPAVQAAPPPAAAAPVEPEVTAAEPAAAAPARPSRAEYHSGVATGHGDDADLTDWQLAQEGPAAATNLASVSAAAPAPTAIAPPAENPYITAESSAAEENTAADPFASVSAAPAAAVETAAPAGVADPTALGLGHPAAAGTAAGVGDFTGTAPITGVGGGEMAATSPTDIPIIGERTMPITGVGGGEIAATSPAEIPIIGERTVPAEVPDTIPVVRTRSIPETGTAVIPAVAPAAAAITQARAATQSRLPGGGRRELGSDDNAAPSAGYPSRVSWVGINYYAVDLRTGEYSVIPLTANALESAQVAGFSPSPLYSQHTAGSLEVTTAGRQVALAQGPQAYPEDGSPEENAAPAAAYNPRLGRRDREEDDEDNYPPPPFRSNRGRRRRDDNFYDEDEDRRHGDLTLIFG